MFDRRHRYMWAAGKSRRHEAREGVKHEDISCWCTVDYYREPVAFVETFTHDMVLRDLLRKYYLFSSALMRLPMMTYQKS